MKCARMRLALRLRQRRYATLAQTRSSHWLHFVALPPGRFRQPASQAPSPHCVSAGPATVEMSPITFHDAFDRFSWLRDRYDIFQAHCLKFHRLQQCRAFLPSTAMLAFDRADISRPNAKRLQGYLIDFFLFDVTSAAWYYYYFMLYA